MSVEFKSPYASPSKADHEKYDQGQNGELATHGQRFLGALVDAAIMVPIFFVLGFILAFVGFTGTSFITYFISTVITFALAIGAFLAINGNFLATRGQTIGKMVLKTKIVSEDGTMVPFAPLILKRYLPFWLFGTIPWIGGIIGLVNVLMIFRENRKCLHDDIAGTKVIQVNE